MSSIVWAVILIAGGIGVILIEMFIPSGGILGLFAAFSICTYTEPPRRKRIC